MWRTSLRLWQQQEQRSHEEQNNQLDTSQTKHQHTLRFTTYSVTMNESTAPRIMINGSVSNTSWATIRRLGGVFRQKRTN